VLYVGQQHDHPWLQSCRVLAQDLSWTLKPPEAGQALQAQVRYRQAAQDCRVLAVDDQSLEVQFTQPQRAVTPGQSIVLYDGEVCLGGGIIQYSDTPPSREYSNKTSSNPAEIEPA
jgi:tRNA-specific 2-thiouridylase